MLFKEGHFYRHVHGRTIAILGVLKTFSWGQQFIIEETDPTGSAISCVDIGIDHIDWTEINKSEWLEALLQETTCCVCHKVITVGQTYLAVPKFGLIHKYCADKLKEENNAA